VSEGPGKPKGLELLTQILEAEDRGAVVLAARLREELRQRLGRKNTPWESVLKWHEVPRVYREREKEDPKVADAKIEILEFFKQRPEEVFYERQLEVLFERQFFHWVSGLALGELEAEGRISSELVPLWPNMDRPQLRFYRNPQYKFWRRKANATRKLVRRFSADGFGTAMGEHAMLLFDAGLGGAGFRVAAKDVRSWGGREWCTTGHDLDRVYERDGLFYGVEIKNTLPYIPSDEFKAKLAMSIYFGIPPLFICRMLPKSYIHALQVWGGGFALIHEWQFYPLGHEELGKSVEKHLGIKTAHRLLTGTVERFLRWHEKRVARKVE